MPKRKLTAASTKQFEVLEAIIRYLENHGYQPTHTELAQQLGCTRQAVMEKLARLEKKGYITQFHGHERAICLHYIRITADFHPNWPGPKGPPAKSQKK